MSLGLSTRSLLETGKVQTRCPPLLEWRPKSTTAMTATATAFSRSGARACLRRVKKKKKVPLLSEGPHLPPPPAGEVLGRDVDAEVFQRLGAQMAVVRPLHGRTRIVALRVGLDAVDAQAHDVAKELADLVLGELVLARELQDAGQLVGRTRGEVFDGHVLELISRPISGPEGVVFL